MKIVRDIEGYFVLDNANQKVNLMYEGKMVWKLPTPYHIGLCYWHSNEKGNIVNTPFEIVIDNITSFKAIKFELMKLAIRGAHVPTTIN